MYQYNATLLNIVDGDTVDMDVDMGFNVRIKQRMRFYGIDTPELNSNDPVIRASAVKAKDFVASHVKVGQSYMIETFKNDKYGRLLVKIRITPASTLNEILVGAGLATIYKP
jgi:micrococcal nuclease